MEFDDFNQLTEFVFDQSTPESDEEAPTEERTENRDAATTRDSAPKGRIIRRRARKACVACHKRYLSSVVLNSALDIKLTLLQKSAMRCIESGTYLY